MRILLLGGTGAMGMSLAPILLSRGDNVFVTTRSYREDKDGKGIHYIQGNAHQPAFLKEVLKEPYDAVVDFMIYGTEEFKERIDLLLSSTRQYVFLSSARVYAESNTPIREDSPRLLDACKDKEYLAQEEYALSKAREENLLCGSGRSNWTIIRPYITYNSNRLQLGVFEKEDWLYRALHGRSIVFQKDIAARMTTLTYGYDVAKAMACIIGNEGAYGESYHITCPETIRWDEALETYLDVIEEKTGNRPTVTYIRESERLAQLMGNTCQVKYDRLYDRVFDDGKIRLLTGEDIVYTSPREGLRRCLEELLDSGEMKAVSWAVQGYMDRFAGERTPLKEIPDAKRRVKYLLCRYLPGVMKARQDLGKLVCRR